ncbi:hypothetical protein F0A17_20245 [Billgrantia pellis]|uniref:Sn-glycerol-3-phosphate transporter n=2 Tax=Billgrantia pellis TaxID=2606936 RepID=A0A7V7FWI2_9GAMM|nr:hypothetical protein F0A17_20245 [Halomonas pellis]
MRVSWKVAMRRSIIALAAFMLASPALRAQQNPIWPPLLELDHALLQTSLYTRHFDPEPDHNNRQELIGLELHNPQHWLMGGARFLNSFHQEAIYLYAGREFPLWEPHGHVTVRAKLTAGLLHGYRGEYQDNIPFNRHGTAPAALPSLGLQWGRFETDLIVFGTAGAMVMGGIRF